MKESRIKKKLLIVAASASVVVATAAGVYYWDAMLVGIVAVLLWLKKMATLKGLLILLKKLPFLLLLGMKRLVIKVTSRFLLFSAHLRFYRVQRLLRYLRVRAYLVKRRLKYHWGDLSGVEQMLATVAALPLVIVLSVLAGDLRIAESRFFLSGQQDQGAFQCCGAQAGGAIRCEGKAATGRQEDQGKNPGKTPAKAAWESCRWENGGRYCRG